MAKNILGKLAMRGGGIIKHKIIQWIILCEGGDKESAYLRKYTYNTYNVQVDLYTYGSCFSPQFNNGGKVSIGRYCSIGNNVQYFGGNHPISSAVMSAYFYNKNFSGFEVQDIERFELEIGHDVWIGANVNITCGCKKIGNGAVIGCGAVVTKDIPPYAIFAGNPARLIRYRFDNEVITKLELSKWWEKSPDELMEYYPYINDPSSWAECFLAS